ncbi:MAG: tyrosine-type recombinase/integrase, partial [Pseudomonadota bacterium]
RDDVARYQLAAITPLVLAGWRDRRLAAGCKGATVRRAGIEDFHFHDLRHKATSRLAEKLPNVIELAAVTGHKDLRMLKRYYHPRAEDLARKLG